MATEQTKPAGKSSSESIPSTCVKRFYDKHGRLVREGSDYVYEREENLPYPWPVLRPKDEALAEPLKKEYQSFHEDKLNQINKNIGTSRLLTKE